MTDFAEQVIMRLEPVLARLSVPTAGGYAGGILGWLVSRVSGQRYARWQVPVAALAASWLFMGVFGVLGSAT